MRISFTSGLRRITPVAEHGASSKTKSKSSFGAMSASSRPSPDTVSIESPSRFAFSSTRVSRVDEISIAVTSADVTAMDISSTRLTRVEENAKRLGLSIDTVSGDGRELADIAPNEDFDLVLLDAPCSATGVMRRNPDVKLIRLKTDIGQFAELQQALLEAAWQKVRPGGKLLYVTCSLLPAENEDLVSEFIHQVSGIRELPLGEGIGIKKKVGTQALPSSSGGDGLYYCMLEKVA